MTPKGYLIGNLSNDPVSGVTSNSNNYTRFSVACNESFQRQNQPAKAHFFNCVCWGTKAEFIQKNIKKGDSVFLEFNISTGSYTNTEGRVVKTIDFIVEKVEILRKKSSQSSQQAFVSEFVADEESKEIANKISEDNTETLPPTVDVSLDDLFDN